MSTDLARTGVVRRSPVNLRIGHDDRSQAVAELQRHYAEGRLDWDELDERLTKAWAARTHADLEMLFNDLPLPTPPEPRARRLRKEHPDVVRAVSFLLLPSTIVLSVLFHAPFIFLFFGWMFLVGGPHHHHQRRASARVVTR